MAVSVVLSACSCTDNNAESGVSNAAPADCRSDDVIGTVIDIPAGVYPIGENRFYPEERPVEFVELAAFNIDATEVTSRQFAAFFSTTGYVSGLPEPELNHIPAALRKPGSAVFSPPTQDRNLDPTSWWRFVEGASWRAPEGPGSTTRGIEDRPVVHIALEDAIAYATWTGRRLPSEDEWEAVANGGGAGAVYSWGYEKPSDLTREPANIWQGWFPVINQKTDRYERTSPAACFLPNGCGLYDMIGNVWELTTSEYELKAGSSTGDFSTGSKSETLAAGVIKSGSFRCAESYCLRYRPAARQSLEWALSSSHIGFRTAGTSLRKHGD